MIELSLGLEEFWDYNSSESKSILSYPDSYPKLIELTSHKKWNSTNRVIHQECNRQPTYQQQLSE